MAQHTKGTRHAPSLIHRLASRSGAMTFEDTSDIAPEVVRPNLRLQHVAHLVERYAPGGDILDIGCWAGGLARELSHSTPCTYTGVDIEQAAQAVEAAQKAMPAHRFLIVSSVESLPFETASFDAVVLTEVIEHVLAGREGALLAEAARVLRPGGSAILSTPYRNMLTPLDPAWFFGHRHYSVDGIAGRARAQGLLMSDVEFSGGVWSALDTNLLYFYKHVLHRRYLGYPWLHEKAQREYTSSTRGALSTTLWCRLVRR